MLRIELNRNQATTALVEVRSSTTGFKALARLGLLLLLAIGTTNVPNVAIG